MAKTFNGFTDSAKLYAQNAQLVDEMFRTFYADMTRFADALTEALPQHVPKEMLKTDSSKASERTKGRRRYRFYCLADDKRKIKQHAYLWFDLWDESLIASNRFWMKASAPKVSGEQLARIWTIPDQPELNEFCVLKGRKRYSILEAQFELPAENPVASAAQRAAKVLKALYAAETTKVLP